MTAPAGLLFRSNFETLSDPQERHTPVPHLPDVSFIEAMEAAVMREDLAEIRRYVAEDVIYTVGSRLPVRGIEGIFAYMAEQGALARWEGHTLQGVYRGADDVLVLEVISHFTRVADNRRISFPCVDIYRFRDGRIADWRVYADMTPFLAA